MKHLLQITLIASLFSFSMESMSQSVAPTKRDLQRRHRIEKKELKDAEIQKQYEGLVALVQSGRFLFRNEYYPQLSYLIVDSTYGEIRTGSSYARKRNYGHWGESNAVGGQTLTGELQNFTIKTYDRRKLVVVKYDILDSFLFKRSVELRLYPWGYGRAAIKMNQGNHFYEYGNDGLTGYLYTLDGALLVQQ